MYISYDYYRVFYYVAKIGFVFEKLIKIYGIVELIQSSFVFSLTLGAALKVSEIFLFLGNPGIYQLLMFFYPFFRSFFFIIFIL